MGHVGAARALRGETTNRPPGAARGITFRFGGTYYPKALDVTSPFGEGHAEASSYLTARVPFRPTLALRVAGRKVWGTYPFYEAAFVGGDSTVRGFVEHRFVGDAAVFGNLQLPLSIPKLFILVPTPLGVFGLGDPGRGYVSGQTSDRFPAPPRGPASLLF